MESEPTYPQPDYPQPEEPHFGGSRDGQELQPRPPAIATAASRERSWAGRWSQLSRSAGLVPTDPVVVALSGGADSVYLLHLVARSRPRPKVLAVHVEHGLRGGEGQSDSAFCARLCAKLEVPFARRMLELGPETSNLEARAREGRYHLLAEEARRAGSAHVVTGHHEDDALETLLMRMMRGSDLPGLPGLKNHFVLAGDPPVTVHRPLTALRREEVRRLLRDAGLAWREDSSNQSAAHTRNRVRNGLLPDIEATCGPQGLDGLRAFAQAVESLEDELAQHTAHLTWETRAAAGREVRLGAGGQLARAAVADLAEPLQRRALWRLVHEGTGLPPSRALLAILLDDLAQGRRTRRSLPGGWVLELAAEELHLFAPDPDSSAPRGSGPAALPVPSQHLQLPGRIHLPDGRSLHAEFVTRPTGSPVPQVADTVELDALGLEPGTSALEVRNARPGDRFHGLGAPGSRPLVRFLADAGIAADDRARIPLVFAGDELIWVAGLRPSDGRRVTGSTTTRLRLWIEGTRVRLWIEGQLGAQGSAGTDSRPQRRGGQSALSEGLDRGQRPTSGDPARADRQHRDPKKDASAAPSE